MDIKRAKAVRFIVPDEYVVFPSLLTAVEQADHTVKWSSFDPDVLFGDIKDGCFMISTDPDILEYSDLLEIPQNLRDPVYVVYPHSPDYEQVIFHHTIIDRATMKQYVFYDNPKLLLRNFKIITIERPNVKSLLNKVLAGNKVKRTRITTHEFTLEAEEQSIRVSSANETLLMLDVPDNNWLVVSTPHITDDIDIIETIKEVMNMSASIKTYDQYGRAYEITVQVGYPTELIATTNYFRIDASKKTNPVTKMSTCLGCVTSSLQPIVIHRSGSEIKAAYPFTPLGYLLDSLPQKVLACYQKHLLTFS